MRTAECVTPQHPDKICDRISDAILDAALEQDPKSRVAVETMGGHGIITITGEMTTNANLNIQEIARRIVGDKYGIQVNIVRQSPEIGAGVDQEGAGDQGIMVGYACNDNESMIPQELYLARSLCKYLYSKFPFDGKTQTTLSHEGFINTIVASFQNTNKRDLEDGICAWLYSIARPKDGITIHANPAGDWSIGGFDADTGLTGRKLSVDNYGPQIPIGGGCFSGKDATKVDRSGAYIARQFAVQYLKATNAKEVIVKVAYAIGIAEPVMITVAVDHGNGIVSERLHDSLNNFRVRDIIKKLELEKPQFEKTAEWGHFGNGFEWDN